MLVYHGTILEIKEPKIITTEIGRDFGFAFYTTDIKEQAERWAKRYDTPCVTSYSILLDESLSILEFKTMTEEWLDFIVDCRGGKPHNYDVVIGAMADDQIYNFISDFMEGVITREQFWVLARFKYPTHQIALCSEKALACIKFESCEGVS